MSMRSDRPEVIVVTGASAGIGRATVREFAKRGNVRIGLIARGVDGLEGAQREVEELGGEALVLPCDVADYAQVDAAAEKVERAFGPIDVWVNDAMVSILAPFREVTVEEFRRVTEVTYLGQVHGARAALKSMLPRDKGSIVFVGSALAHRSIPLQAAYCGAKHAILGFFESLRCELLHDKSNVKVAMVQLPGVNTTQFEWIRNRMPNKPRPVGTPFQPEVAARAIHWAAYHDKREVYVGIETVEAVMGEKVAASMMDQYMADTVYSGHQTNEPDDPNRPDNLFHPVPGDHGAHGPFDDESKTSSPQLYASTHTGLLALATIGAAAAAYGIARWAKR